MRAALTLLVCTTSIATGCTINSGVKTTPTFQAARFLPPSLSSPEDGASVIPRAALSGIQATPGGRGGAQAVLAANRSATVEPTAETMEGATWVIDDHDQSLIYRLPVQLQRVATLLLPPGEKFNGAMGGNVEGFLINVAYAGPRPAVSILPREGGAQGNLQLATTAGIYSFDLVTRRGFSVNLVDISRKSDRSGQARGAAEEGSPQPEGDFTRLHFKTPSGAALPAWAPVEAWADSVKMVIRFQGPLPVLPALFAGQKGEQIVAYRTVKDQGSPVLVTNRRITEGELRLDQEVVGITVDGGGPDGVTAKAGTAGTEGWSEAAALPSGVAQAAGGTAPVNVYVLPGSSDGVFPATALTDAPFAGSAPASTQDPARGQPLANHVLLFPGDPGV